MKFYKINMHFEQLKKFSGQRSHDHRTLFKRFDPQEILESPNGTDGSDSPSPDSPMWSSPNKNSDI